MSTVTVFQICLDGLCAWICVAAVVFVGKRACESGGVLQVLWVMTMFTSVLAASDALGFMFDGYASTFGFAMVAISNFLVFFTEGVLAWCFALFAVKLSSELNGPIYKNRFMVVCSLLGLMHFLMLIITQFTGWFYYYDDKNNYVRGEFISFAFIILLMIMVLSIVKLIINRKKISSIVKNAFLISFGFFGVGVIIQIFIYGIATINITLTFSVITLLIAFWREEEIRTVQERFEMMEQIIKEIRDEAASSKLMNNEKIDAKCMDDINAEGIKK